MRKNNIVLVVLITLLTAFFVCSPALAGPTEEEKLRKWSEGQNISPAEVGEAARVVTNDEIRPLFRNEDYLEKFSKKGKPFNPLSFNKYWSLAYGDEHGTFDQGEYRYIGYTNHDEAFTNFWFRPDFVPGGGFHIDKARWIKKPFYSPLVSQFLTQMGEPGLEDNPFLPDNPMVGSKLRPHIVWGLKALAIVWPGWYKFDEKSSPIQDWENYVHILQPPSFYCFGTGRMFHQARDGSIWYLDVPLPPGFMLELDLKAELEKDSYQGKPGEKIDTTATFSLAPEYNFAVTAKLRVYIETKNDIIELPFSPVDPAKKLNGNKYTFRPGESLVVNVSFTVPNGPAELVAHVDAVPVKGKTIVEANSDNNEARAPISATLPNLLVTGIELAPEQGIPGRETSGTVHVLNRSDRGFKNTLTVWKIRKADGSVYDEGSLYCDLAPGEGKALPLKFTPDAGGLYSVAAMINPNHDNPPDEVNYLNGDWPGDNRKEVAYQVEYPCTDVSVTIYKSYSALYFAGNGVRLYAHVSRADDGPAGPVDVFVRLTGPMTDKTATVTLGRGESKTKKFGGQLVEGLNTFTASAWPVGAEDCAPGNNASSLSVNAEKSYEPPQGDTSVDAGLTGGGGLYWYR